MAEPKKYLFIANDGPYGNERPYHALRMAMNLAKRGRSHPHTLVSRADLKFGPIFCLR